MILLTTSVDTVRKPAQGRAESTLPEVIATDVLGLGLQFAPIIRAMTAADVDAGAALAGGFTVAHERPA